MIWKCGLSKPSSLHHDFWSEDLVTATEIKPGLKGCMRASGDSCVACTAQPYEVELIMYSKYTLSDPKPWEC